MNKYFITYCDYKEDHPVRIVFEKYTKPRFEEYCKIHGFEFILIDKNIAYPRNLGFSKVFWIKDNISKMNNGDVITYMDIDCCIVDGRFSAVFDADFAIVKESTGCLCMGGTWSLRVSDWSRNFINVMCSNELHEKNKNIQSWNTWHENDAIYHVLGLQWGEDAVVQMGTRNTTNFNKEELDFHVKILPVQWGVTYNPNDVDWTKNKFEYNDQKDPDWIYKIISQYYRSDMYCENIIVRHLSAGTLLRDWALNKYLNQKMII